jgi:hypothetical protein
MGEGSAAAASATLADFRIGRVFARTTAQYRRNFLPFSLIAFVASLPSVLIVGFGSNVDTMSVRMFLLSMLVSIVLFFLSQAALVYGAFQDLRGRTVDLIQCLRVGLARLFPVLAIALVVGLSITLVFAAVLLINVAAMGTTFAVAPSVVAPIFVIILATIGGLVAMGILLATWFVAVPACTVERFGVIGSLRRSAQLTKGHRWRLFAVVLLLLLAGKVTGEIGLALLGEAAGPMFKQFGLMAWNTVWGAFFAVFVVVTYYELWVAKEGIDAEQIAAVFD